MQNGNGIMSKSPDYIRKKLDAVNKLDYPENLLDPINKQKYDDYISQWKNHLEE